MAVLAPYTYGQLEAALEVLRAERTGEIDRARIFDRSEKFGLRNRCNGDLELPLSMPVDDDDPSGDFDPTEERREARRLAKRRTATRNPDDEEASSSSSVKRARTGDDAPLIVKWKLKIPGAKWFLRSLEPEKAGSRYSSFATLPEFESNSDAFGGNQFNIPPFVNTDNQLCYERGTDPEHGQSWSSISKGKEKETYQKPEVPYSPWSVISRPVANNREEHFSPGFFSGRGETSSQQRSVEKPLTSDSRIMEILGLEKSGTVPSSAGYAYCAAESSVSSAPSPAPGPSSAPTATNCTGNEEPHPAQAWYSIIPNIGSVQVKNRRGARPVASAGASAETIG